MKNLFRILALMCLVFPIAATGAQEKVSVGIIYGESAVTTDGMFQNLLGTRFAIEDLNREGGILGKQIDLVELNNNGSPIGSKHAAESAVKRGVIAVIGPKASSHSVLAGAVLQEAKIPMISAFDTNPDVTLLGDYIFRICFQDRFQSKVLADFAIHDLKAKTAVVITCAEEKYSLDLATLFISRYRENGGTVLWEGEYLNSFNDFRTLLEKANRFRPSVIFLPGYDRASGFIIRQCRKMGENVTFLGADAWSDNLYEYGGESIEGSFYSAQWYPDPDDSISSDFVSRYAGKFQHEDIISFSLSHDAVFLLADAASRAGSLEPSLIRDALAATKNFQGITGTITMDQNGDPAKPISILKFQRGGSVLVKTVAP